ncbi:MAG: tetratricopeptide repeat protein [Pseudomonadales bacterium]
MRLALVVHFFAKSALCRCSAMLCALLLAGCATSDTERVLASDISPIVEAEEGVLSPEAETLSPPVRAFPEGALLELLLAEVAGYRGAYDQALAIYREQALQLGDPGVAARTARLARYLKNSEVLAEVSAVWAALEPENIEPLQYLTDDAIKNGEYQQALGYMETIDQLGGDVKFDFFAYRAQALSIPEAQELLDRMTQMDEGASPHLQFSRAALLERVGDFDAALPIAEALNLNFPDEVNYLILRVNLLDQMVRHEEAMTLLSEYVSNETASARIQKLYAQQLLKLKNLDAAREIYKALLLDDPEDGDVLFALALLEIENKALEDARLHLLRLTRLGHRPDESHFYLGVIAEALGDQALAIREYEMVRGGYQWLPALRRVADLIATSEGLDEGRRYVVERRERLPHLRQQLIMLEAQLISDQAEPPMVLAFLDEAVAEDPENVALLYYRGMMGQQLGRMDILERDLSQVLTINPEHADAMNALGYTLADQTDRFDEALALITKALALRPDEPAFIDSMGWVLFRLGRFEEARSQLERAYQLFPNDEVASHLGEVLWMMGKKREAKKVWRKAKEQAPDSPYISDVYQRFDL